ncbi:MAG: hypothetical protein ACON4M_08795 [Crocinitomicaceae bacterium]
MSNEFGSLPSGFYITKNKDGSLNGKLFTHRKQIYDITFYDISKDSLVFGATVGNRSETFIMTSIDLINKTAIVIEDHRKDGDKYIIGSKAEQDLIDYDKDFYLKVIGKDKSEENSESENNLPKYSDVRAELINSKDSNLADKLLGKADEVYQKNLLTYRLYYFAATQNGKKVHVRVVYDHRDNYVDEVTSHELGVKIQVGRFNFIQSPR